MIRARVECIGSRAEIGVSYATVGLRAATDFLTAIGGPGEGPRRSSEELGRLEGVGEKLARRQASPRIVSCSALS